MYRTILMVRTPLAEKLNEVMIALTESFTDMDCRQIDAMIGRAVTVPTDKIAIDILRNPPRLKNRDEIHRSLKKNGLSEDLASSLYEPIRSRCMLEGESCHWWRKGFGYALVIGDGIDNNNLSHIKIMPGVYVGPGGVVEAQGVILQRPEDCSISMERAKNKSIELHALQRYLENHYFLSV